jgi:hypothetical protein
MLLSLLVLRVVSLIHTGSGFVPVIVGPKGSEGQLVAHWWMPLPELGRNYNNTLSERLALISGLNSNWNTSSSSYSLEMLLRFSAPCFSCTGT